MSFLPKSTPMTLAVFLRLRQVMLHTNLDGVRTLFAFDKVADWGLVPASIPR